MNTQITPYESTGKRMGLSYGASVAFDFEKTQVLETLELELFPGDGVKSYFRLSLGDNPSVFDSYLVAVEDVEKE